MKQAQCFFEFYQNFCTNLIQSSRTISAAILLAPMVYGTVAIAQTPENPLIGVTVNVPGGGCLNARRTPSSVGEVYDCISNGSVLKPIIKAENGWYQLSSGGWVWMQYTSRPGNAPDPTPDVPPRNTPPTIPLQYIPNNPIRGEAVRELQEKLNEFGIPVGVDGVFGLGTKRAVEALQTRHGLVVDGIVGDATRKLLQL
jgi:hypothetical protein